MGRGQDGEQDKYFISFLLLFSLSSAAVVVSLAVFEFNGFQEMPCIVLCVSVPAGLRVAL